LADIWKQGDELLATTYDIHLAASVGKYATNAGEHLIADRMAKFVAHALKVVDVEHNKSKLGTEASRPRELIITRKFEKPPIRERCKRIVSRFEFGSTLPLPPYSIKLFNLHQNTNGHGDVA
jgi:hypothetical protein